MELWNTCALGPGPKHFVKFARVDLRQRDCGGACSKGNLDEERESAFAGSHLDCSVVLRGSCYGISSKH